MNLDAEIKAAYEGRTFGKDSKGRTPLYKLAEKFGISKGALYHRAMELGVRRQQTKSPAWSDEEMQILEQNSQYTAGTIVAKLKARGFSRTKAAVVIRRNRALGTLEDARVDAGVWTAYQLSKCLGVNPRTITYWISKGMLKANKTGQGDTCAYLISPADLRRFVIDYTAHVPFSDKNKHWIVDILCPNHGLKAAGREL